MAEMREYLAAFDDFSAVVLANGDTLTIRIAVNTRAPLTVTRPRRRQSFR